MSMRACRLLLLAVAISSAGPKAAAADNGWMQPGVRVWYLGAVGTAGGSSNAEEAFLLSAVDGGTATVVHHSALTHWTSPKPVETSTYALADMGPFWIHPARLQTLQMGDYWMGHEITLVVRTAGYASLQYQLLPAKALLKLNPQREMVRVRYMIAGFSTGDAYFDAETGILLFYSTLWGYDTMFFILAEINYDFANQIAFAEDDGPHTGFRSFVSEQSMNFNGIGGGSVIIQSLVETRYGATVEMRVQYPVPPEQPYPYLDDKNYCFFGDVPLVTRMDATQAPSYPPEQWNPWGQYLWWWLPSTATGVQAASGVTPVVQAAAQNINVYNVPMTKTSDSPLTYVATQTPATFHFSTLWFDSHGYLTAFAAKGPGGLHVEPSDDVFQNLTRVDGTSYYRSQMAAPPPVILPTVTRISPATGSTLGGTVVTITGTAFAAGATVTMGGLPATNVVVVNKSRMTLTTPAHAAGPVEVIVANPDGHSVAVPSGFTYVRPLHAWWGAPGDVPIGGDYDGDGRADLMMYRPSAGEWYGLLSSRNYDYWQGGYLHVWWGQPGDVPIPGDYDGDRRSDLMMYRPTTGEWFGLLSGHNYDYWQGGYLHVWWGQPGDHPFSGDYDGDGRSDLMMYRPATGEWFGLLSGRNYDYWQGGYLHMWWGQPGDLPSSGDFDGDGKSDVMMYRPSTGEWLGLMSTNGYDWSAGFLHAWWGAAGDVPVPIDYDGDGRIDLVVWRPSTGEWLGACSSDYYNWP